MASPSASPNDEVAVIGSGIAGLSAAWLLSRSRRVALFEKEQRPGGHSNTIEIVGRGGLLPVDTGFMVFNEVNYPNLTALFRHLGVTTKASDMSFAASLDGGSFEYSSLDFDGVPRISGNMIRPRFWSMISGILRFYREAPLLLDSSAIDGVSLGDYLDRAGYSRALIQDHILPMSAAIWSASATDIANYPLNTFLRFFVSHRLMSIRDRLQWLTVEGGSRDYVRRMTGAMGASMRLGLAVKRIYRKDGCVIVQDVSGGERRFSHVVIATHADQALGLLGDADPDERRLLGAFKYATNRTLLHSDPSLMPRRRRVWSSWNFLQPKGPDDRPAPCVTYWMNKLQSLDPSVPLFVTLNPAHEPDPKKIVRELTYEHPQFDQAALRAQSDLWTLQGRRNTWFCGSYFGYGFHEDALQAGLAAAEEIGEARRPWTVPNESGRIAIRSRALAPAA
ncbi:NAD(P)/FAD-dependent oxidoreductase [Methylocapsa palsarum]|uniref:Predicted NAD/FAD-binding protein n=1 Tax=Methylocapsa palsarum TaxID=1612308 RepID=A0A1I4BF77_9HYPH|nr:FAD-dependent oxidoreductase [Methylocapsa palsarum]SFK66661.1 Predicted NAD/FAD-binding protein [Methylocapsa palsarum]